MLGSLDFYRRVTDSVVCVRLQWSFHSVLRPLWVFLKGGVERSRRERLICSLLAYFLLFWLQIFQLCLSLSVLHPLIWFFFKNSFRKKKNIQKTTQNALAPSIFIVLSIVLKLGTPLLQTKAQNTFFFWDFVGLEPSGTYCKVTNFRPVPIFVLLTWNWFVRTNFCTFEGLKTKLHWNSMASGEKQIFIRY